VNLLLNSKYKIISPDYTVPPVSFKKSSTCSYFFGNAGPLLTSDSTEPVPLFLLAELFPLVTLTLLSTKISPFSPSISTPFPFFIRPPQIPPHLPQHPPIITHLSLTPPLPLHHRLPKLHKPNYIPIRTIVRREKLPAEEVTQLMRRQRERVRKGEETPLRFWASDSPTFQCV
jgi:hypothetical protein